MDKTKTAKETFNRACTEARKELFKAQAAYREATNGAYEAYKASTAKDNK